MYVWAWKLAKPCCKRSAMAARWVDSDITNKQTDKPTDYYNPWPPTRLRLIILQFEFSLSIVMLDTWMWIINSISSPRTIPTTIAKMQWARSLGLLGAVDCLDLLEIWPATVDSILCLTMYKRASWVVTRFQSFTETGWRPNLIMY